MIYYQIRLKKNHILTHKTIPLLVLNLRTFLERCFKNGGRGNPRHRKVPDKVLKVDVSVLESYKGVTKNLSYQRDVACNSCSGSGGDRVGCNGCGGTGAITQILGSGFFQQQVRSACPQCQGKGYNLARFL